MIPVTPRGRRAEEFAAALEGRGDAAGRHEELLEVVGALRSVPAPQPRPEYVADLRARLMAEAEVALGEVERKLSLPASSPGRRDRRIGIAAGAIALVGVTSSVAVASQSALPGDTLYPIKRAIEGASTTLTVDDSSKADRILGNAKNRLAEVESLAERGKPDKVQLGGTIEAFTSQAEDGADLLLDDYAATGDEKAIEKLHSFTAESIARLGTLGERLPESALAPLAAAVDTLASLDDLASKLCPACDVPQLQLPPLLQRLSTTLTTPSTFVVPESPVVLPTDAKSAPASTEETEQPQPSDVVPEQKPTKQPKPQDEAPSQPNAPKKDERPKGPISTLTDALAGEGAPLGPDGLVDDLLTALLGDGLLD